MERLRALAPRFPVVSEEDAGRTESERRSRSTFWLVDPLDGTKEFLKRNGEFTVNIALIDDGRPVLGVVHVPVTGVTYAGSTAAGAVRIDGDAAPEAIAVREPQARELTVVASRSHRDAATERLLAAFGTRFDVDVATKGSSLKICEVAEGRAHLYPRTGPTMEWDTAAAQAVLEAAGGVLLRLDPPRWGEPLRYGREDARNPAFVAAFGRPVLAYPGMAELREAA